MCNTARMGDAGLMERPLALPFTPPTSRESLQNDGIEALRARKDGLPPSLVRGLFHDQHNVVGDIMLEPTVQTKAVGASVEALQGRPGWSK